MAALLLTAAQRDAMYRQVVSAIPGSFIDPEHPDNQALAGAMAYAIAYAKELFAQLESGLFLDTAGSTSTGADGFTGLQRWGVWLQMEPVPGETADQFRTRLAARLFSPRCTLDVIETAIQAATGLVVRIDEPQDRIIRLNDGAWRGKRLLGNDFGYMMLYVVTEGFITQPLGGTTAVLPRLMPLLRGAGVHWRHFEVVSAKLSVTLLARQAALQSLASQSIALWPRAFRLNHTVNPGGRPPRRRVIFTAASYLGLNTRIHHTAGAMLVAGPPGAPLETVLAHFVPPNLPALQADNSLTLWDESIWSD
jgi:hypothetical protein